ncbi:hypothetical protein SDC9_49499 [bioreactor metagenome]|uniref:Uncharacterized protein n=1 Tax=bioreactor metagenome TaxID=1076179 RepID=A0A644WLX6_9ZZZZ
MCRELRHDGAEAAVAECCGVRRRCGERAHRIEAGLVAVQENSNGHHVEHEGGQVVGAFVLSTGHGRADHEVVLVGGRRKRQGIGCDEDRKGARLQRLGGRPDGLRGSSVERDLGDRRGVGVIPRVVGVSQRRPWFNAVQGYSPELLSLGRQWAVVNRVLEVLNDGANPLRHDRLLRLRVGAQVEVGHLFRKLHGPPAVDQNLVHRQDEPRGATFDAYLVYYQG